MALRVPGWPRGVANDHPGLESYPSSVIRDAAHSDDDVRRNAPVSMSPAHRAPKEQARCFINGASSLTALDCLTKPQGTVQPRQPVFTRRGHTRAGLAPLQTTGLYEMILQAVA